MRRRLARVAEWLAVRVAPRVDPAFLAAAERARVERLTGRPLEATTEPPVSVRETSLSNEERAAWAEIVAHWVRDP